MLIVTAYIDEKGNGFYIDCPKCHFYKNNSVGNCRRIGCDGMSVAVHFTPSQDVR